jgi:hypothetical protein
LVTWTTLACQIAHMDHTGRHQLDVFLTIHPTRVVTLPGGVRFVTRTTLAVIN